MAEANEKESKTFDDALLDVAWKSLDSHCNRFKDIDNKAIGIITISGILMTFLAKPVDNRVISTVLFILTAVFFFITILLSVIVIRTRKYEALSTEELIKEFCDEDEKRQIRGIIGTIAETEKKMCEVSNAKARELKYAIYALSVSIVSLIFYSVVTYVKC